MTTETKPKVLIGSPVTALNKYKSYCLTEYLDALNNLRYPDKEVLLFLNEQKSELFPFEGRGNIIIETLKNLESVVETVVSGRNILRQRVLDEGFNYLMFIEQDIIEPSDLVERLMQHQKDVCSALYFNEMEPSKARHGVNTLYFPMAWNFDSARLDNAEYSERLLRPEDLVKGGLMQVDVCGLAAVLIRSDVLEKISFRYIDGSPPIFEEFCFGRDCRDKGIDIYLDASCVCRHYSARGL